jgi:hypothetical protein
LHKGEDTFSLSAPHRSVVGRNSVFGVLIMALDLD